MSDRIAKFRRMGRLVACLASACIAAPQASAQEAVANPDIAMDLRWEIGAWTDVWRIERFNSAAVQAEVSYYLYLPPGYDQGGRHYPVVYWLHGAYGRPYSATPVVRRLDAAIRNGDAPSMIVVSCIDPTGLSMWTNSKDGQLPMETILVDELIPHIDATYRTVATRDGRGIEGFSMGGYGAAYLGARYHGVFSSVSIMAGALHTPETFRDRRRAIFDNVFSGDAAYARERSPWTALTENADKLRGKTTLRIFVGADDGLLEWNENYHQRLEALNIGHEWGVVPDAPHNLDTLLENWDGNYFDYYTRVFGQ